MSFRNQKDPAGTGTISTRTDVTAVGARRYVTKLCVIAMVTAFAVVTPGGSGQFQRIPPPLIPGGPPEVVNPREDTSRMAEKMRQERNVMRQKKLVAQTALLQKLALELNENMSRTDNTLSEADIARKSEQIGKLAKSIRELMIGPL